MATLISFELILPSSIKGTNKEGNEITLIDVIENSNTSIEDEIDMKLKIKKLRLNVLWLS